ncbi:unnamed protein product [Mytilus coruscus]|uniref:HYR domain-containing protein n=1 Tax=Mytilus coruscus TaxID=42192 RepID=A0A6J8BTW5_MYTCO|nr:unnamed protein product [Mytilus coruscus]
MFINSPGNPFICKTINCITISIDHVVKELYLNSQINVKSNQISISELLYEELIGKPQDKNSSGDEPDEDISAKFIMEKRVLIVIDSAYALKCPQDMTIYPDSTYSSSASITLDKWTIPMSLDSDGKPWNVESQTAKEIDYEIGRYTNVVTATSSTGEISSCKFDFIIKQNEIPKICGREVKLDGKKTEVAYFTYDSMEWKGLIEQNVTSCKFGALVDVKKPSMYDLGMTFQTSTSTPLTFDKCFFEVLLYAGDSSLSTPMKVIKCDDLQGWWCLPQNLPKFENLTITWDLTRVNDVVTDELWVLSVSSGNNSQACSQPIIYTTPTPGTPDAVPDDVGLSMLDEHNGKH